MHTYRVLILFFFIGIGACTTNPTYYPEKASTPLFNQAKQLSGSINQHAFNRGYSADMAYAINKRHFISGKYSLSQQQNCTSCITNIRDYRELALGKYGSINDNYRYAFLFGFGQASSSSHEDPNLFSSNSSLANASFKRSFLQYNISTGEKYFGRWLEVTRVFIIRGSYVKNNFYQITDINTNTHIYPSGKDWSTFLEPAGSVKFLLFKTIGVEFQAGFSIALISEKRFNHDFLWFTSGVQYHFSP